MALKGNQGTLKDDVEDLFRIRKPEDKANTLEKNRGRIKSRTCEVIRELDQLENREKWVGLKSIIKISSIAEVGDKKSTETRLYISSLESTAEDLNHYIREHWGIENSLHWTLDVTFNEDRQRKETVILLKILHKPRKSY